MRRLALKVGLTLLALMPGVALAYTSPGAPSGYVNDFARVLNPQTVQALNTELAAFHASTSNEIAVVTVQNMDGDYIENFAVKLFEEWGIGTKDKNNGVLLLLSIDERKLRIEVGYGLEGALPDSLAQRIITNDMTPLLKLGDYDAAVTKGVHQIVAATKGEYVGSGAQDNPLAGMNLEELFTLFVMLPVLLVPWLAAIFARSKSWWAGGVVGALAGAGVGWYMLAGMFLSGVFALALGLFGLMLDFVVSKAYTGAKASHGSIPWWAGGGGFGGSGHSSGGGFGGFGGGRSGGGGASGGW